MVSEAYYVVVFVAFKWLLLSLYYGSYDYIVRAVLYTIILLGRVNVVYYTVPINLGMEKQ